YRSWFVMGRMGRIRRMGLMSPLVPLSPCHLVSSSFLNPQLIQRAWVVAPMLLYADEEIQPDVASEQIFDVAPCFDADLFQSLPALADDDRFLRLALDVDDAMDFSRAPGFLPHLGPDGGGKGELLRREFQNLFADEFRRDVALDFVGEDFGVVKLFAFGQMLEELFDQRLLIVAFGC